jgi:hypothetical protein
MLAAQSVLQEKSSVINHLWKTLSPWMLVAQSVLQEKSSVINPARNAIRNTIALLISIKYRPHPKPLSQNIWPNAKQYLISPPNRYISGGCCLEGSQKPDP